MEIECHDRLEILISVDELPSTRYLWMKLIAFRRMPAQREKKWLPN